VGSRERVAAFLLAAGIDSGIREFDESTRSSALAAAALGCSVSEIAKSVVFVGDGPVVAITSGDRRVDPGKLAVLVGTDIRLATPGEVRELTGYPIGGVPPFPHDEGVRVYADRSLARNERVWVAAGAPNAVFQVRVDRLAFLVGGILSDLS
jgi:prolyl-tRNA editing enzyme YbaK/EbsC (Cys-tRNA(Pro) deacylase)